MEYSAEQSVDIQKIQKKIVRQRLGIEDYLRRFIFILIGLGLFIFLIYPISINLVNSFENKAGEFVGLVNYIDYFSSSTTSASLSHSIYISMMSMGINSCGGAGSRPQRLDNTKRRITRWA